MKYIKNRKKDYIWIIGASTGIGEALTKELAKEGHSIAFSARNEKALINLHNTLPTNNHLAVPLDVSNHDKLKRAQEEILNRWPRIDKVIFMAGIYHPMHMGSLDLDETRRILEVNLMGAFNVAEVVLPHLLSNKGKQLVFCASVAGYRGLPKGQPYGASKAGLINMVESLNAEHGKKLDIKLINPGFVESRLTDKNDFHMPLRISTEQAATAISEGLKSRSFEIHFPKRFTFTMKLLRILPNWLYYRIIR